MVASAAMGQQAEPQVSPAPAPPPAGADPTLPEVVVDTAAEEKKAAPKKKRTAKSKGTGTATGTPPPTAAQTKATGDTAESAWGPVDGYVATRSATGTKTDTPLLEVPQSVSVITRDQMTARKVQEDSDVLLYTPGVFAQPFGGALNQYNPHFIIRGFSSAEGGSYVDGLPAPVNYRSEPYGLERIEVMRGPSSVLYGQGEPGGIVNRIHKNPTEETFRELTFQFGNYDRLQPGFDFGGAATKDGTVLYRMTGLGRFGDAAVDYDFDQELPYERKYFMPAITWRPSSQTSLTLRYEYLKDDTGQDTSWRRPDGVLTHLRVDQPNAGDFDYEHSTVGYSLEHRFTPSLLLRQNVRYTNLDYDYVSMFADNENFNGNILPRFTEGFDTVSHGLYTDTMLQASVIAGPVRHQLLTGLDYRRTTDRTAFAFGFGPDLDILDPDYSQPVAPPDVFDDRNTESTIAGLYLQDQMKFFEKIVLTLGGRHDWYDAEFTDELFGGELKQDESAFTYRAGVSYLFLNGLAPYASYSESFLPTSGLDEELNPFKPTTGTQYEAGIKYQPTFVKAFFAASVFDLTKQNVVFLDPDPLPPNLSTQVGEIRNRGLELEGTVEVSSALRFIASYTYIDSEITKSDEPGEQGSRAQLVPKHMASIWGEYELPSGPLHGLVLGGGVRYIGSYFADNTNTLENDASTIVDASLRYDLEHFAPQLEGAEIAVNVSNLFDKEHQACFSAFDCRWTTPRTVLGTLTYRW